MTDETDQTRTPPDDPIIMLQRTFDAHRDLVWQAWTDPAQLAAWYAPDGFGVPRITLEFRVGGVMDLDMEGPDGTIYPTVCRFEEIVPPERIVLRDTVQASDAWGETPPPDNHQTITFEALPGNRTRVRVVIRLGSLAARDAMFEMGAATGWNQTLSKLGRHLAAQKER